jgi:hypothetical protein
MAERIEKYNVNILNPLFPATFQLTEEERENLSCQYEYRCLRFKCKSKEYVYHGDFLIEEI